MAADIFDQVSKETGGDIFDHVANENPSISHGASGSWTAPQAASGESPWVSPTNPLYAPLEGVREGVHQLEQVGRGVPQIVTGIPGAIHSAAKPLLELSHGEVGKAAGSAADVLRGLLQPATTSIRGLGALIAPGSVNAPTQQEWNQAAQGAGALAGGIVLGEAGSQYGPAIKDTAGEAASKIINAPRTVADYIADRFKPKPDVSLLRATGSSNPDLIEKLPIARAEIAQWADDTGKSVTSAPLAREAIDERIQHYNAISDQIAGPQRDVVVPGSRAELAQAKIAAIPDEVRLNQPKQYANRVNSIQDAAQGPEYTIGDLDDLRKDLAAKNKSYGKNLSGQISAEHSNAAIDAAAEKYARGKFYDALFENSGDTSVQDLKQRIGALIETDNALRPRENQSIVESGKPLAQKAIETAGKIMTPGTTLKHFGENATIDSDIASAIRQTTERPTPINPGAPKLPNPVQPGVRQLLQLGPAQNSFQIDPSAGPLYGQPTAADRLRGITRTAVEPGEGIPMRDVTPPKRLALNSAPAKIATYIEPSSGKTIEMPGTVVAKLAQFLDRQKQITGGENLGKSTPKPTAADVFRLKLRPEFVPDSIISQMAAEHMNHYAGLVEGGVTQDWGRGKVSDPSMGSPNAGEVLQGRIGGGRKAGTASTGEGTKQGTPFAKFPESPSVIAKAIRAGKGPLFDRLRAAAVEASRDYAKQYIEKQKAGGFDAETQDWFN